MRRADSAQRTKDSFDKFYGHSRSVGADLIADEAFRFEFEHCLSALKKTSGNRILDVGCGNGRYAIPLALQGNYLVCVDVSVQALEALLKSAREFGVERSIETRLGDFSRSPFDGEFDACLCVNLFHHVPDRGLMMQNIFNTLKTGGQLLLIEPNPRNVLWYVYYAAALRLHLEMGFLGSTPVKIRRLATTAGFRDVRVIPVGLFPLSFGNTAPFLFDFYRWATRVPLLKEFAVFNLFVSEK